MTIFLNCVYKNAKQLPLLVWFYIIITGFLSIFLAFVTPPMKGIDEPSHFFRALQISEGHLFANKYASNVYGGEASTKMSDYASYMLNNKEIDQKKIDELNQIPENKTVVNFFSTSATYSPIMYIPLSAGLFVGKELKLSIYDRYMLGKITNVIVCSFLLLVVVLILPYGRYFTLFFLTTPSIISMSAYYNADTFTNLIAVLFIACCLRLQTNDEYDANKLLKLSVLVLAMSLGLLKITYCFYSLLVFIVPLRLFKNKSHYIIFTLITVVSSAILAVIWNSFYKFTPGSVFHTHNDPRSSLDMLFKHPFHIAKLIIHTFYISIYTWSYDIFNRFVNAKGLMVILDYSRVCFITILMLTFFVEKKINETLCQINIKLALSFCSILIIFIAFYVGFSAADTPIITGIQARYFIIPILLLSISVQSLIPNRYKFIKLENPLLIVNFLCVLYVVIKATPLILTN